MGKMGRPIDPNSARQKTPWKAYGMSRATFYWRKGYDDLPEPKYPFFDDPDIGVECPFREPKYPFWNELDMGVEGCEKLF